MIYNDEYELEEVPKNHAVLKIKNLTKDNFDDEYFEEMINSDNTLISIDFSNGKSLCESGFSKVNVSSSKYYLEFFDEVNDKDIIEYLEDEKSDFRVTCQDGTVIRPSLRDLDYFEYKNN